MNNNQTSGLTYTHFNGTPQTTLTNAGWGYKAYYAGSYSFEIRPKFKEATFAKYFVSKTSGGVHTTVKEVIVPGSSFQQTYEVNLDVENVQLNAGDVISVWWYNTVAETEIISGPFKVTKVTRGGTRYKPFAFTEQGVAMLSSVLNSPKAIEINIQIIRAFVFLRQYALTHKDLTEKLKELESHFDKKFKDVYEAINYLLQKDTLNTEQTERNRIGYKPKE